MADAVSESMQKFRQSFAQDVTAEIRAKLNRFEENLSSFPLIRFDLQSN